MWKTTTRHRIWLLIATLAIHLSVHAQLKSADSCSYSSPFPPPRSEPDRIGVGRDGRSLEIFHNFAMVKANGTRRNIETLTCRLKLDCEVGSAPPKGFKFMAKKGVQPSSFGATLERGAKVQLEFDGAMSRECTIESIERQ